MAKVIDSINWKKVDFGLCSNSAIAGYIPVGSNYGWVITIAHLVDADYLDADHVSVKLYAAVLTDDEGVVCEFDPIKSFTFIDEKGERLPDLPSYVSRIRTNGDFSVVYYEAFNSFVDKYYTESLTIVRESGDDSQLEILCCDESTADVGEYYLAHYVYGKVWNEDINKHVLVPFNINQHPNDKDDLRRLVR